MQEELNLYVQELTQSIDDAERRNGMADETVLAAARLWLLHVRSDQENYGTP